jgi:hypothetical protein
MVDRRVNGLRTTRCPRPVGARAHRADHSFHQRDAEQEQQEQQFL